MAAFADDRRHWVRVYSGARSGGDSIVGPRLRSRRQETSVERLLAHAARRCSARSSYASGVWTRLESRVSSLETSQSTVAAHARKTGMPNGNGKTRFLVRELARMPTGRRARRGARRTRNSRLEEFTFASSRFSLSRRLRGASRQPQVGESRG